MIDNSTQNNKLDGFIKKSLEEAEVPFNPGHWDEMEYKLNALPQAGSIKKWSFSTNIIVGAIAVLGGGILLYNVIPSSSDTTAPVEEVATPVTVLPNENVQQSIAAEQSATAQQNNAPANEQLQEPVTKEKEVKEAEAKIEKKSKENKKEKTSLAAGEKGAKPDTVASGRNKVFDSLSQNRTKVPTFGDMIDPEKGFVKETSEAKEVKEAVEEKIKSGETDKVLIEIKKDSTKRNKVFKTKEKNKTTPTDSAK